MYNEQFISNIGLHLIFVEKYSMERMLSSQSFSDNIGISIFVIIPHHYLVVSLSLMFEIY